MKDYKFYHIIKDNSYYNEINISDKEYALINTFGHEICGYLVWKNYELSNTPALIMKVILDKNQIEDLLNDYILDANWKLYATNTETGMIDLISFSVDELYDWYINNYERIYQYWLVTKRKIDVQ